MNETRNRIRKPRYLCWFAALLLMTTSLLSLASCADNSEKPAETGRTTDTAMMIESTTDVDAETEVPKDTLDVPDVNYNGYVFRVRSIKFDTQYTMLDVEKITSEPVNDAIYERNRLIEDRFGIRFQCDGESWQKNLGTMRNQVNAGYREGESYDLIMLIDREAYTAAVSNFLLPYEKMEYVDMDTDYYFRDINQKYRFGDHTFFAFGRDSINVLGFSAGLLFNKTIAEDQKLGNLYDTVRDHEWTYERLFTYAEAAASDLDGDGKYTTGTDMMGLIGHHDDTVPCFWVSAGEYLISKDENNLPISTMDGNERLINIMQDALNHLDLNAYDVYTATSDIDGAFMNDLALFYSDSIRHLANIRAMETDYGLLPWPKYNADQENYITRSYAAWPHCVPTTCQDPEMTGIILQALAYYSRDKVYDAYYEQSLSTRYLRDSDSVEMLQLMLSTLQVDLGDTIWLETLGAPIVGRMRSSGAKTALASTFKSFQRKGDQQIRIAIDFIEEQNKKKD